jgi:hypothetical protein
MDIIVGFLMGVAASFVAAMLWDRRLLLKHGFISLKHRDSNALGFDPTSVGLFVINQWSPARPLDRKHLITIVSASRPAQAWFDHERYSEINAQIAKEHTGSICYLTGYKIDHHESERGKLFEVTLARCDYSEHLATVEYLTRHPEVRARVTATLAEGDLQAFAKSTPPSSVKINVAVVSLSRKMFLAVQRSSAVHAKKNIWTVGPNEIMKLSEHLPGISEDFFTLAERCLREELGLEPFDYGPISISWIGYYLHDLNVKIYAQVRLRLTERDFHEKCDRAESIFESRKMAWLPFDRGTVLGIIQNWQGDRDGRTWSDSAPLSLQELWRMRDLLLLN